MEVVEIEISSPQERTIVKTGPNLGEAMSDLRQRENILKSCQGSKLGEASDLWQKNYVFKPRQVDFRAKEESFSEAEGLKDLADFIETVVKTAQESGDSEIKSQAEAFRDNLVFVGEKELREATQGIAQHLLERCREGKQVIVFPANTRSERYIALRILEEVDASTDETPDLRQRIRITQNPYRAARQCKENPGSCLIVVPDDFIVTGTRIQAFASTAYSALLKEGFTPDEASQVVEANVVASPDQPQGNKLSMGIGNNGRSLRVFSFYGVPEYRDSKGIWFVFSGVSMTGSHSSTDYGFEQELKKFHAYLSKKGAQRNMPLLANLVRPYQTKDTTSQYQDPELQTRWEKTEEKYGLK